MELKIEILCKNYKHKKIIDKHIIVQEDMEEYYVIPITKSLDLEYDDEIFKLTFINQPLWLKYSNHKCKILINEYNYDEYIIIKSKDIVNIHINIHTTECFKKNIWYTNYATNVNKKYKGRYMLVIPVFEDMIHIKKFGEGIVNYQIHMNSNEVLLKQVKGKEDNNGYIVLTKNIMGCKEALFIPLKDKDVDSFLP